MLRKFENQNIGANDRIWLKQISNNNLVYSHLLKSSVERDITSILEHSQTAIFDKILDTS